MPRNKTRATTAQSHKGDPHVPAVTALWPWPPLQVGGVGLGGPAAAAVCAYHLLQPAPVGAHPLCLACVRRRRHHWRRDSWRRGGSSGRRGCCRPLWRLLHALGRRRNAVAACPAVAAAFPAWLRHAACEGKSRLQVYFPSGVLLQALVLKRFRLLHPHDTLSFPCRREVRGS